MANRVALITGGSRGLGRGIAVQLAREGYGIAVNYAGNLNAAEETAQLCREIGGEAELFRADVADYGQVKRMIADVIGTLGDLYAVIANAGISHGDFRYITDCEPADWRRLMEVNLNGIYHTFHAAAPHLIEQKAGRMVAISSLATRTLNPGFGPYAVSKSGVDALVQVMGKELAQYGVLVNGVSPGLFDTDMGRTLIDRVGEQEVAATIPVQRVGRPEEVGDLVAYLVSDKAAFIAGEIFHISGGGRGVRLRP